jgi:arsenate reductase
MGEAGVDISRAVPKPIERFLGAAFDYVITVCGEAEEACPVFMGRGERLHWPVADPAVAEGDEATRLEVYRAARDEIRDRVQGFLEQAGLLASNEAGPVTG